MTANRTSTRPARRAPRRRAGGACRAARRRTAARPPPASTAAGSQRHRQPGDAVHQPGQQEARVQERAVVGREVVAVADQDVLGRLADPGEVLELVGGEHAVGARQRPPLRTRPARTARESPERTASTASSKRSIPSRAPTRSRSTAGPPGSGCGYTAGRVSGAVAGRQPPGSSGATACPTRRCGPRAPSPPASRARCGGTAPAARRAPPRRCGPARPWLGIGAPVHERAPPRSRQRRRISATRSRPRAAARRPARAQARAKPSTSPAAGARPSPRARPGRRASRRGRHHREPAHR